MTSLNITENYPTNSHIIYKTKDYTFEYSILQEGMYPSDHILCKTRKPGAYPIPHSYVVLTKWNKASNKLEVRCSTNYIKKKPLFRIYWKDTNEAATQFVSTYTSPSACVNLFLQVKII
jgi:hypothetical protein